MDWHLWIALGDSITEGYEAGGEAWVKHTHKDCRIRIHNLGISGDTTADLAERAPIAIESRTKRADTSAIIFIGTNDCYTILPKGIKPISDQAFEEQLLVTVAAAKKYCDRVLICELVGLSGDADLYFEGKQNRKYVYESALFPKRNAVIHKVAEEQKIELVKLYEDFQNYRDKFMSPDGLHPNANGQKFISARINNVIKK